MTVIGTVCYIRQEGRVLLQRKSEALFGGGNRTFD